MTLALASPATGMENIDPGHLKKVEVDRVTETLWNPETGEIYRVLTTAETAKIFGTTERTLRYYHKRGLISPKRDQSNNRLFDQLNVFDLIDIFSLVDVGFPLKQIDKIFSSKVKGNRVKIDQPTIQLQLSILLASKKVMEAKIGKLEKWLIEAVN